MEHPAGESDSGFLRVDSDRRLKLKFHGSRITSDAGMLIHRKLDDALGLTDLAGGVLSDGRKGKIKGGDLGGIKDADRHCQALATAADAGNKIRRAYLSHNAAGSLAAMNARSFP